MPFWSNQTLLRRLPAEGVVSDFDQNRVKYCAYELSLGDEVFLTSNEHDTKELIESPGQISVPPGQFALLITKEKVAIPRKAIAFISIKAGIKFRGLLNVSGFHVDPGFEGRLKFSVYNAGGQNINLSKGAPIFLIFFADLDHDADPSYGGVHQNQMEISSNDVMEIQGKLASPALLDERIKKLENLVEIWSRVFLALGVGAVVILAGISLKSCVGKESEDTSGTHKAIPQHVVTNQILLNLSTQGISPAQVPGPGTNAPTSP